MFKEISLSKPLEKILHYVFNEAMGLRNILLIISCIIVGFCLSLYFQTETPPDNMHWNEYQSLQYSEDRSHSLQDLNKNIQPQRLEDLIQDIYEKNHLAGQKTRVMEIGTGNGRVLMELQKRFPEVEFYGINKEKTHTFYRRESFVLTALKFQIFTKRQLDEIHLPYAIFQDLDFGQKIPYDNDKFDLIFSQDTIGHIKYKFELFNEILRVLKPNGISLHADMENLSIYSQGLILDFKEGIGELRRQGMDVKVLENDRTILFKKRPDSFFSVSPHQPLPSDINNLSQELRRPEMGYNIVY